MVRHVAYSILQPPCSLNFRKLSRKELALYAEWFLSEWPRRVRELSLAVQATKDFSEWSPDYTPESIAQLGLWFSGHVEKRNLSAAELAELAELRRLSPHEIEAPATELTIQTFSLAFDVAIYLARVVLTVCPGTSWSQCLQGRNTDEFGRFVVLGLGPVPTEPLRLVVTLAYAIAAGESDGLRLRSIFDYWTTHWASS